MKWWGMLAVLAAGCGNSPQGAPMDLGATFDLNSHSPDLAAPTVPIGGPCTQTAQCAEGQTPVCFTSKLFNKSGFLATPGGYCSSRCTDDSQCGAASTCIDLGSSGKWCMAICTTPSDCRGSGYACFRYSGGYCFPSGNLNCDPTAGDGTCTLPTTGGKGGCLRDAVGSGVTGTCIEGCTAGAGSCAVSNGSPRQCVVYDQSSTRDLSGNLTGDKFHGAVCIFTYSQNAVGAECKRANADGTTSDRIDACADGAECYITFFTGGDNLCHAMCLANGDPDAGAPVCPAGTTCSDVFSLFATANPVG
ncbi:MAG TPA: hypothetical protein VFF06_12140, partial [Polyangia bacterium]|nr:hypothetical protein [Polyangia bacterium]